MHVRVSNSALVFLVAVLALLPALILGLQIDFPLLDDQYYFWSIQHFCESGELKFMAITPTCFIPLLIGALSFSIFGPNYAPLHVISLLFTFGTALSIFFTLQELGLRKSDAICGATVFLTNPMIVFLSVCYMTELPWLFFTSLCLLFLLQSLKKSCPKTLGLSVLSLIGAILCRQTGLLLAIAYLIPLGFFISKRRYNMLAPLFLLIPAFVLAYLAEQFAVTNNLYPLPTIAYKQRLLESLFEILTGGLLAFRYAVLCSAKVFSYMGFYLLPLVAPMVLNLIRYKKFRLISLVAMTGTFFLCAVPLALAAMQGDRVPYSVSIFFPPYVGAYCLFQDTHKGYIANEQLTLTIILIAVACAFSMVFWSNVQLIAIQLLKMASRLLLSPRLIFAGSTILVFTAFLSLFIVQSKVINFDRYNIVLFIPTMFLICMYGRNFAYSGFPKLLSWGLLLLFFLYSNFALLDCFSFNSCKWSLIRELRNSGVSALDIDAGPEFNLISNPELFATEVLGKHYGIGIFPPEVRGGDAEKDFRWWPISGNRFVLSNREFPGYTISARKNYWSPLRFQTSEILVLKRQDSSTQSCR